MPEEAAIREKNRFRGRDFFTWNMQKITNVKKYFLLKLRVKISKKILPLHGWHTNWLLSVVLQYTHFWSKYQHETSFSKWYLPWLRRPAVCCRRQHRHRPSPSYQSHPAACSSQAPRTSSSCQPPAQMKVSYWSGRARGFLAASQLEKS